MAASLISSSIVALIEPIRQRRLPFEKDPAAVLTILKQGTARANAVAEETLWLAKKAIKQDYFERELKL